MNGPHYRSECLFCRIADGHLPAHIVWETERLISFLDIRPIRPGHVQIIPRTHYAYFDDLPADIASEMVSLGQNLARVLKPLYSVRRVAFLFTGGDIPHVHAHVVPIVESADITSRRYIAEETVTFRATPRIPDPELAITARTIAAAVSRDPPV